MNKIIHCIIFILECDRMTSNLKRKENEMKRKITIIALLALGTINLIFAREWRMLQLGALAGQGHRLAVRKADGSWETSKEKLFALDAVNDLTYKRCQVVGGKIYVMCSDKKTVTEGDATVEKYVGKVIRFTLDGVRMDEDSMFCFDGKGDGMTVTPDEKYVFITIGEETYAGRVYRYTVATGVLETNFAYIGVKDSDKGSFIREACCDNSGHLYVADRSFGHVYKYDVQKEAGYYYYRNVYLKRTSASSDSNLNAQLTGGGSICYSSAENCLYHAGKYGVQKLNADDLTRIGSVMTDDREHWFDASCVIAGVPYIKSARVDSENKEHIYAVDKDTLKLTSVSVAKPVDICAFPRESKNFTIVIK